MCFETLGNIASVILVDIARDRVAAPSKALVNSQQSGEIERVAWLRATDQTRRIDASLLTENYRKNWDVHVQGSERMRQAHLLERARRQVGRGRTRQLS